jgi:hypothetical protein
MSVQTDPLNQDLNSTKTTFSPAHQHLEPNAPEAIMSNKSKQEKLDRLGMESARRAGNRFSSNAERLPEETTFSK